MLGLFSQQSLMPVATDATNNENVLTQKKGNHKDCSYEGFVVAYFRSNLSCRLPPTPRNMKIVGAIRESPLREG